MTAAWAAIWLADSAALELLACPPWLMPTCDRFDILVDGRVGSNSPGWAEYFLVWFFIIGEDDPPVGTLAGREKLWCRLEVLALDWVVRRG